MYTDLAFTNQKVVINHSKWSMAYTETAASH